LIAAHATNISMCLSFLGIFAHLRTPPPERHILKWEGFAILSVIASGLAYEVFFAIGGGNSNISVRPELATDWPPTIGGRTVPRPRFVRPHHVRSPCHTGQSYGHRV
jgi:hypothetical protein